MTIASLLLTSLVSTAFAQTGITPGAAVTTYADVKAGVWFEEGVESFVEDGYLDATQPLFRPADPATRAEFIKLVVEMNGGILQDTPEVSSFDDVPRNRWFYAYMEEAAREGWVKGDGDCYGTHPCMAHPNDDITRAEAAVIARRAFNIRPTGDAPPFIDVDPEAWYADSIQTMADHCFMGADDVGGKVRALDLINRAEMAVMLHRIDQNLTSGSTCDWAQPASPEIHSVTQIDFRTIEVEFSTDIDADDVLDLSHYSLESSGSLVKIVSVWVLDPKTVQLEAEETFGSCEEPLLLTVQDVDTADGETFSDSMQFKGACVDSF
jgi:hypothetical protein